VSDFHKGERVLVDRSLVATFVRYSGAAAVIQVGLDSRIVDPIILSRLEA